MLLNPARQDFCSVLVGLYQGGFVVGVLNMHFDLSVCSLVFVFSQVTKDKEKKTVETLTLTFDTNRRKRSTQASIDTFTDPVGRAVLLVSLGVGRAPSGGRSG